eukprot:1673598-Pyramimonas_sp.AAC.1
MGGGGRESGWATCARELLCARRADPPPPLACCRRWREAQLKMCTPIRDGKSAVRRTQPRAQR